MRIVALLVYVCLFGRGESSVHLSIYDRASPSFGWPFDHVNQIFSTWSVTQCELCRRVRHKTIQSAVTRPVDPCRDCRECLWCGFVCVCNVWLPTNLAGGQSNVFSEYFIRLLMLKIGIERYRYHCGSGHSYIILIIELESGNWIGIGRDRNKCWIREIRCGDNAPDRWDAARRICFTIKSREWVKQWRAIFLEKCHKTLNISEWCERGSMRTETKTKKLTFSHKFNILWCF